MASFDTTFSEPDPQSRPSNLQGFGGNDDELDDFEFNCPQYTDFSREDDWDQEDDNADGFFAVRVSSLGGHDGVSLPHYMRMSNTHRFSISGESSNNRGTRTSNLGTIHSQRPISVSENGISAPDTDAPKSLESPVEPVIPGLDSSSDDSTLYDLAEKAPVTNSPREASERPFLHQTAIKFGAAVSENQSETNIGVSSVSEERAMADVTNNLGALNGSSVITCTNSEHEVQQLPVGDTLKGSEKFVGENVSSIANQPGIQHSVKQKAQEHQPAKDTPQLECEQQEARTHLDVEMLEPVEQQEFETIEQQQVKEFEAVEQQQVEHLQEQHVDRKLGSVEQHEAQEGEPSALQNLETSNCASPKQIVAMDLPIELDPQPEIRTPEKEVQPSVAASFSNDDMVVSQSGSTTTNAHIPRSPLTPPFEASIHEIEVNEVESSQLRTSSGDGPAQELMSTPAQETKNDEKVDLSTPPLPNLKTFSNHSDVEETATDQAEPLEFMVATPPQPKAEPGARDLLDERVPMSIPGTPPVLDCPFEITDSMATPIATERETSEVPPTVVKPDSQEKRCAEESNRHDATPASHAVEDQVVFTPPTQESDLAQDHVVFTPPSPDLKIGDTDAEKDDVESLCQNISNISMQTGESQQADHFQKRLANLRRATPKPKGMAKAPSNIIRRRAQSHGSQQQATISAGPSYLNATKSSRAHERASIGSVNQERPSSTKSTRSTSSAANRFGFRTEPKTPALQTKARMNARRETLMSTTSLELARVAEKRKELVKQRMLGIQKVRKLSVETSKIPKPKLVRAEGPKLSTTTRPRAARAEKMRRDSVLESKRTKERRASGPARLSKTDVAPFNFESDRRQQVKQRMKKASGSTTESPAEEYVPLAAKVNAFYSKAVRGKSVPVKGVDLTDPLTPRFATENRVKAHRRRSTMVKSTQEMEEEYVRTHNRFTAREFNPKIMQSSGDLGVPKVVSKPTCQPKAFSFHTDKRAAARPSLASTSLVSGKASSRSCAGSVRSTGSRRSSGSRATVGALPKSTVPEPFNLSTASRAQSQYAQKLQSKLASEIAEKEEAQTQHQTFKARPVPDFSRPSKVAVVERKQPTIPKPFNLVSVKKHEQYEMMHRMELERLAHEEELKRQFKATQVPRYPNTPQVKRSDQELTQPVTPECLFRSEQAKELMEMKRLAQLENEKESKVFHANPVPVTTHRPGFKAQKIPYEPTKAANVVLNSDIRARERSKFEAEQRKHAEQAARKKQEDDWARKVQEDRALKEQREAMRVKAREVPDWVTHPRPLQRVKQAELTNPESPLLMTKLRSEHKQIP